MIIMFCIYFTVKRNALWQTEISLIEDALHYSPFKARLHYNLGRQYKFAGFRDRAISEYMVTLALNPDHCNAHFNLGVLYIEVGEIAKARNEFELAMQIKPDFRDAQIFLNYLAQKKDFAHQ